MWLNCNDVLPYDHLLIENYRYDYTLPLKLMLLLNFPIRWSSNWKKHIILIQWYLNRYYLMSFIRCYYQVSFNGTSRNIQIFVLGVWFMTKGFFVEGPLAQLLALPFTPLQNWVPGKSAWFFCPTRSATTWPSSWATFGWPRETLFSWRMMKDFGEFLDNFFYPPMLVYGLLIFMIFGSLLPAFCRSE